MASNFEILRPVEEDTSSTLYLVHDKKRGRESCLRRFKTQKPEEIAGLKELFMQISHIDSPQLQRIVEFGTDREGFFAVTETPPPGEPLTTVLERGPLTEKEFESVARQLLDVLDALHEQAIVHGSLRTDYVRVSIDPASGWQVTLHGFGQGFAAKNDSKEEQVRAYRCTAPEQWQDGTTRRRTDIYALGCVLYEALAARPAFDGKALKELRLKHLGHDVPPLQKLAAHAPAWMCAWVMHLLAADPELRPRKAAAARELFERREAPPTPEPPPNANVPIAAPPPTPTASPHPFSAPVALPVAQPAHRHITSSTIPIAAGPHVATQGSQTKQLRQAAPAATMARKHFTPLSKPSDDLGRARKHLLIASAAVALVLAVAIIPRCGRTPPPAKTKPASSTKGKPASPSKTKPPSKHK